MAQLEARIAALVDQGDLKQAVVSLLEGYGPEIRAYLHALLTDPEAAEDAYSVFQVNVWKGLASWRRQASARSWAYRVAWNAATRFHRDPWRRRRVGLPTGAASRLAGAPVSSEGRSLNRRLEALAELRARLAPAEQTLLILKVDRNLSWSEVALVLAQDGQPLPLPALRKRFERLTHKLARLAAARGLLKKD
jgi:RNA polymerase sigma-70 factor (ECF subfamily)